MLFIIDPQAQTAREVSTATLAGLKFRERYDLQEWVLATPRLLGEDLLVITSEFSGFDRTSERLDILAIDTRGKLVIVELKRSAVGTHAELQALRYAAYCSNLSLTDVAEIYADYLRKRGEDLSHDDAVARIRGFVEEPGFEGPDNKPRLILAAEEFPPEITATVMWLRTFQLDLTCVRLRPHMVGEHLVLDSSVL
ncbi:MAG TPA: endonuclease NucS domain-containing protein, partial [Longimicrobium sp.]|nr:endonuclease NucS domain-containing protein [Longimicrobium sp.]